MIVTITLTTAGADTGPFDLYSDVDGYIAAFETGVAKAALLAGYTSNLVPNGTTIVRVLSTGVCTNFVDITISGECTTTTTTTTEAPLNCTNYDIQVDPVYGSVSVEYFDCEGNLVTNTFMGQTVVCAETGTLIITGGGGIVTIIGPC